MSPASPGAGVLQGTCFEFLPVQALLRHPDGRIWHGVAAPLFRGLVVRECRPGDQGWRRLRYAQSDGPWAVAGFAVPWPHEWPAPPRDALQALVAERLAEGFRPLALPPRIGARQTVLDPEDTRAPRIRVRIRVLDDGTSLKVSWGRRHWEVVPERRWRSLAEVPEAVVGLLITAFEALGYEVRETGRVIGLGCRVADGHGKPLLDVAYLAAQGAYAMARYRDDGTVRREMVDLPWSHRQAPSPEEHRDVRLLTENHRGAVVPLPDYERFGAGRRLILRREDGEACYLTYRPGVLPGYDVIEVCEPGRTYHIGRSHWRSLKPETALRRLAADYAVLGWRLSPELLDPDLRQGWVELRHPRNGRRYLFRYRRGGGRQGPVIEEWRPDGTCYKHDPRRWPYPYHLDSIACLAEERVQAGYQVVGTADEAIEQVLGGLQEAPVWF